MFNFLTLNIIYHKKLLLFANLALFYIAFSISISNAGVVERLIFNRNVSCSVQVIAHVHFSDDSYQEVPIDAEGETCAEAGKNLGIILGVLKAIGAFFGLWCID